MADITEHFRPAGVVGRNLICFTYSEKHNVWFQTRRRTSMDKLSMQQNWLTRMISSWFSNSKDWRGEKGYAQAAAKAELLSQTLVRQPHVLLLDEATSALMLSEGIVQKALDEAYDEAAHCYCCGA